MGPNVTFQCLEGVDKGKVFRELTIPLTIGREEGNLLRLNDERVSRFHAKIQEDGGQIILTDLESTNGTRVNGHPAQMRVLQIGDQIVIGRCLLVYGSPEEIYAKAEALLKSDKTSSDSGSQTSVNNGPIAGGTSFSGATKNGTSGRGDDDELPAELFPDGPPAPPRGLRPLQRAQVSDVLGYCHEQIRRVLHSASEEAGESRVMRIDWQDWQRLLRLEMDLAASMKKVADPDA
jgi:predicted component of type VI protein secretion system